MIRIRGEFRPGSSAFPTIRALVVIPRLSKVRIVDFLIDTGADSTTLHPVDTRQMGIRYRQHFAGIPMGTMYGIGGEAGYWEEVAELKFLHEDLANWDVLTVPIHIAVPTRNNSSTPSLLGRDVLQFYRFTSDPGSSVLTLERPG